MVTKEVFQGEHYSAGHLYFVLLEKDTINDPAFVVLFRLYTQLYGEGVAVIE